LRGYYEIAYIPYKAKEVLPRYDEKAEHYEFIGERVF
jgi:hypothetical protein